MQRFVFLLTFVMFFQNEQGRCGFTLEAPGFGVKRIVATESGVLATDGMSMLLLNAQGEKLAYRKFDLDYSYLLQDATNSNGVFYFLYQHTGSSVRFALLALNSDLTVRWLRDYEQAGATFGYAMAAAPDGVLVAGRSCAPGFFLCNVGTGGDVAWLKTYASGNATALPGALVTTPNGFVAAFKINSGGSWHLGMLKVDQSGVALNTTLTPLVTDVYVKDLVQTESSYAVLMHRAGGINTIATFDLFFHAQHQYDIVSTNPLQFSGIQVLSDRFVVCGNALQSGSANLDMVYGTIDPASLLADLALTATAAYDDARCIVKQNQQLWIGGNRASHAFVGSFSDAATMPCAFTNIDATVTQTVAMSVDATAGATVGPSFNTTVLICSSSSQPLSIVNFCTVAENPTAVHNEAAPGGSGLAVYPNPNNGDFTIATGSSTGLSVYLFDVCGKLVQMQTLHSNQNSISIRQPVVAGPYVVTVVDAESALVETRRIVVMP